MPALMAAQGRRRGRLSGAAAVGAVRALAGAEPSRGSTPSRLLASAASRAYATHGDAAAAGDEDGCCVGVRREPSRGWRCEDGARSSNATRAHLPLVEHVEVGEQVGELCPADLTAVGHAAP